ncbi:MAG: CDP-alcohol phosphatidyltransferase family protein [Fidelibacterota bacterium]|nr:MAG: CDP-alcohol phosphatidyltransferase family protein [Candidatus Neomarinimicrobiota bacterium]
MIRPKLIADILTFIRFFIALSIIFVSLTRGQDGLHTALLLLLLGWMTDTVDGQLARRDPGAKHTWIGDNDIIVDVLLALSILIFFSLSAMIPFWLTVFYLVYLILAVFVFTGWTLYAAFIGFSYGTCLLMSYLHSPRFFVVFLLYIAFMLLTTWSHCWENIQSFFTGIKAIDLRESSKKSPS